MKKTSKILVALCIILMILSISVMSFAATNSTDTADIALDSLTGKSSTLQIGGITTVGNQIITIIRVVGTIVSVVVLLVLGIKYMMGSAEEKAEYKKTMIPYLIGAILLFAASNIISLINSMAETFGK